jgi:hypothetical protein
MDGRRVETASSLALAEHDLGEELSIKKGAFCHHQRQWLAVWTKGDGWRGLKFWLTTTAGEEKSQGAGKGDG